jgi:hypothetical protein
MFQLTTANLKRFAYSSFFVVFLTLLFTQCRKQEFSSENNEQQVIEKFLKIPVNADPSLKLLINDLRKRDLTEHFITKLAKEQGYPLWEKVEINRPGSSSNLLSANTSGNNSQSTHFIIPILKDSGTYVNATLLSKLKDSSFSYKLFRKGDYKNYNLKDSAASTVNAKNIVSLFLYLERKIFDKRSFQITDKRLFKNDKIQKMFIQISSNKSKNFQSNEPSNSPSNAPCQTLYEIVTETYTASNGSVIVREYWTGRTMQVGDCEGNSGGIGSGFVFVNANQLYSNTNPFNNPGGSPGGGGGGTGGAGGTDPGQCIICEGESGNGYTAIQIANSLAYNNLVSFLSLSAMQSSWLVTHPEYVITLNELMILDDFSNESIAVSKIVLNLAISEKLNSPFDNEIGSILNAHLDPALTASPNFNPMYWQMIGIHMAFLKLEHPEWSNLRCFWEANKMMVHLSLDVAGLVPGFGEVADLANGVIYTIEGNGIDASLAYASAVPILGWGTTGAKVGRWVIKFSDNSTTVLNYIRKANGLVNFGTKNSAQFRKVLGLAVGDARQAHHLIPWEIADDAVVQAAALSKNAFHLQKPLNGIPLSTIQHMGSHPNYTNRVNAALKKIYDDYGQNISPNDAYQELNQLISKIRTAIINNPNTRIDDIIF